MVGIAQPTEAAADGIARRSPGHQLLDLDRDLESRSTRFSNPLFAAAPFEPIRVG
jgi:hypothetical protein